MYSNESQNNLRLSISNFARSHSWTIGQYTQAQSQYNYWKTLWSSQFKKISPEAQLSSDNFMRQKEIYSLHIDHTPIALVALDIFNLQTDYGRDHSYFNEIPEDIFQILNQKKISKCITLNQLLVSQMWFNDLRVVDLITGVIVHRLYTSNIDWGICYTRNIGKVNKLALRWGGESIKSGFYVHNEPSDFVVFPKNSFLKAEMPEEKKIITQLWDEYLSLEQPNSKLNSELGWNTNHYKELITKKGDKYELNTQCENSL